jgi:6-pyruvoyltetrahydropterin/6-carboxytetrahydropterin synthase
MAKYLSTKTYGTDRGLSCCFRQWRANHSHCSLLHGYSLGIRLVFESTELDEKNWGMDFGSMKPFKAWADWMFDHTTVIAQDDPNLDFFKKMAAIDSPTFKVPEAKPGEMVLNRDNFTPFQRGGLCDLRIVEGVGCEMFAKMCFDKMADILKNGTHRYPINPTVRIKSVEVFEHAGNSATYEG